MTESQKKTPLWNEQQQQALAALNLTLWQHNAKSTLKERSSIEASNVGAYCYKSGLWLLVSEQPFAVELPRWLRDLNRACSGAAERPAELSPSALTEWDNERVIHLKSATPSATDKKLLWQQLAQAGQ